MYATFFCQQKLLLGVFHLTAIILQEARKVNKAA